MILNGDQIEGFGLYFLNWLLGFPSSHSNRSPAAAAVPFHPHSNEGIPFDVRCSRKNCLELPLVCRIISLRLEYKTKIKKTQCNQFVISSSIHTLG